MKKIVLIIFILFNLSTFSQEINHSLLDKLTKISFLSIDEFITEGYGFTKIKSESNLKKRAYARDYSGNPKKTLFINVISSSDSPNGIEIYLENYDIRKIKDELLELGYDFNGLKNEFSVFKKEKKLYLISKPNKFNITQIIIMSKW
ncbi:hypothetical protein [uncultured Tenacibaculum sp.]|uniref:hypothetical protein n=1 Tax=uncultured Tenacibaculum sp. TaxID=174713 RepID=UPI002607C881|nr:hypothetical protein [uncultured Tenacibaculum sp.]